MVTQKRVILARQPGQFNAADLGTKHLDRGTMTRHLEFMGYHSMTGRSAVALRAALGPSPQAVATDNTTHEEAWDIAEEG
eukprot:2397804-Amphidinium_carterae.1